VSHREVRARAARPALRAILYLRISDLTDTSTSMARQEKAGRSKAHDLDAGVTQTFKDVDKSGYHAYVQRPGWEAALSTLRERRADVLIVFKVDRATRQGIPQASEIIRVVYETGCRFISLADGIDSEHEGWELQLTIAAHQAHRESKNAAFRVADLRADERDAGRWMGPRPYGFLVTPDRKLEVNEEEAEVIRSAVRKLLDGESLRSVAAWVNAEGHDSLRWASRKIRIAQLEAKGEPLKAEKLRGKPLQGPNSWSWPVVRNLVLSPLMTGYLPHKGEIHRHSLTGEMVRVGPEIIPLADHTRLRGMFGTRVPVHWTREAAPGSRSKATGRAATGLLSDFLHCDECGARMSYDAYWIRDGKPWPRYRCARRQMSGRCPGTLMKGDHADALVGGALIDHLNALADGSPALLALAERWADLRHPERRAQRRELQARIQNEEAYLDRMEDEKLNGLFRGERGERRFRRRYDACNERLEQYEEELAALDRAPAPDLAFVRDAELFEEAWKGRALNERREILGLALNRAWLFKARTSGVKPSVDRFRFWWAGEPEPTDVGLPLLCVPDGRPGLAGTPIT